jgi:hypothetical protein
LPIPGAATSGRPYNILFASGYAELEKGIEFGGFDVGAGLKPAPTDRPVFITTLDMEENHESIVAIPEDPSGERQEALDR